MVLTKAIYLNPCLYKFANLLINVGLRKYWSDYDNYSCPVLIQRIALHLNKLISHWNNFFANAAARLYGITISFYYRIFLFTYLYKLIQNNKLYKKGMLRKWYIASFYFIKNIRLDIPVNIFIIFIKLRLFQTIFEFLQSTSNNHLCQRLCQRVYQSTDFAKAIRIGLIKLPYTIRFSDFFYFLINVLCRILRKRHFRQNDIVGLKNRLSHTRYLKKTLGIFIIYYNKSSKH